MTPGDAKLDLTRRPRTADFPLYWLYDELRDHAAVITLAKARYVQEVFRASH